MSVDPLRAIALVGLLGCLPAAATSIYTTGGTPPLFSNLPQNAWQIAQSGANTFTAVAESFVPATTLVLTDIVLPVENVSGPNELQLIIESGASQPTTVIETINTVAATSATLIDVPSALHPMLNAGTQYWIVVTTTGTTADWQARMQVQVT
jgi:hypothetical protein